MFACDSLLFGWFTLHLTGIQTLRAEDTCTDVTHGFRSFSNLRIKAVGLSDSASRTYLVTSIVVGLPIP